MRESTVVVDDCATPARPNIRHVRFRATPHAPQNFTFKVDRIAAGLPRPLTDTQLDWLQIVGALYAADLASPRGEGDTDWWRRIELHVPVHDPQYWQPFVSSFQELFALLTYDSLSLELHQRSESLSPPRQSRSAFHDVDSVALLSGGMDSFVGAAELMESQGRAPLFVSHTAAGATRSAQRAIEGILLPTSRSKAFVSVTAQRAPGFGNVEGSQRGRTLLFVGCAVLVASALDVRDVFLNENGVMAVHLPLTEARVGSLSTRTASPIFLERIGGLASAALGTEIDVSNILLHLTKADVVALGLSLGHRDDLKETVSCWSLGHTGRHCGYCGPCLIRRIACETHGAPDVTYEHDGLNDPVVLATRPFAKDNLVHLIETAQDVLTLSDADLELDYPELLNGGRAITAEEARDLHRRWASQALSVIDKYPTAAAFR